MLLQEGRSGAGISPSLAEGWRLERLTPPSRLFGANGLRTGPDGRIYIAQVTGSQISALDIETGRLETISAKGGDIIAPDDVAFDPRGNLYATEVMDGRVSARSADGHTRVLRDDVPSANGITVHQGRLFIGECREGGRLLELDLGGGPPRVLLENVPSPNAMEVGPDGLLYFPVMGANEIWRIDLDGGAPETVATGLGVPDSVKFDSTGHIVSTQVHSGQVLRIDPRTGKQTVLADLNPGLDNSTFVGDRLFVSNFTGEITEILDGGRTSTVLPGGLNWPLDLAVGADGHLYVADGTYFYVVLPDRTLQTVGMLFSPGYPGFLRGVVPAGPGEFVVTTSGGQVSRYRPAGGETEVLADGFDQLYGVAIDRRRCRRGRRTRDRTGAVDPGRAGRGDRFGLARSGRAGDCARRRLPGLRSGRRAGGQNCRVRRPDRGGRVATAARHSGARAAVVRRRRRRQGVDRRRSGGRDPAHHCLRLAAGRPTRRCPEAVERHAAVLRSAGAIRRHRRRAGRHPVRVGRCGGQRAGDSTGWY